jgi:plastocyanin
MSSSISMWLLKIAPVPALVLAMLSAGCENGKQPTDPPALDAAERGPATQPVQLQDVPAPQPVQSQDVPAPQPVQSQVVPAPQLVQSQDVAIDNFSFNPHTLTVAPGTIVTWVNRDDVPHTVTANGKAFDSKALDTDDRFSHAFTAPGIYPYFCAVHPHMTGQIIVK